MIDADLFKQSLESVLEKMDLAGESQVDIADGVKRALRLLKIQPEVDAAPVVHGRWGESSIDGSILSECQVCHFPCGAYTFQYCPNCGAKMDIEKNEVYND